MQQINFYVPESHLEAVKEAMFNAGAGLVGPYARCCWQIKGQGQFMPLENSNPSQGEINKLESVSEYKVEMVCADKLLDQVIAAMQQAHPYEQVAYSSWAINLSLD